MLPVIFSIGSFHLYSFSIFLIFAWVAWSFTFWRHLRSLAIQEERIFDIMFYVTIAALVSSRLGYVATHPALFSDSWLKVIALWVQPGLSLYGALIGSVFASIFLALRYNIRIAHVLDGMSVSYLWGFAFGTIGALLDGSVVGKPASVWWAIRYVGHIGKRHPVELYALVSILFLLVITRKIRMLGEKNKCPYGIVAMWCFGLYAPLFFAIEFFTESGVYWGSLSANQWICVGILGQSLGAFYVRGGGKGQISRLGQKIKETYDKFSKRHS